MYQYDLLKYRDLYINSFMHFAKKKSFIIYDKPTELNVYLLDKRFITTNDLDKFQYSFPKCKLKHLDDYWIVIYSSYYLNNFEIFKDLTLRNLIVSVETFIRIVK